jgi:hypothetical protein
MNKEQRHSQTVDEHDMVVISEMRRELREADKPLPAGPFKAGYITGFADAIKKLIDIQQRLKGK